MRQREEQAGEPMGDVQVKTSRLRGAEIGGALVVRMIDEFPILMVAATQAQATTIVREARESARQRDRPHRCYGGGTAQAGRGNRRAR